MLFSNGKRLDEPFFPEIQVEETQSGFEGDEGAGGSLRQVADSSAGRSSRGRETAGKCPDLGLPRITCSPSWAKPGL